MPRRFSRGHLGLNFVTITDIATGRELTIYLNGQTLSNEDRNAVFQFTNQGTDAGTVERQMNRPNSRRYIVAHPEERSSSTSVPATTDTGSIDMTDLQRPLESDIYIYGDDFFGSDNQDF